jgi:hypothetical protein
VSSSSLILVPFMLIGRFYFIEKATKEVLKGGSFNYYLTSIGLRFGYLTMRIQTYSRDT